MFRTFCIFLVGILVVMMFSGFLFPSHLQKGKDALERADLGAAIEHLLAAEKAGSSEASILLGRIYRYNPAKLDYKLAKTHFETAVKNGANIGYAFLGDLYADGLGVKKDLLKAEELCNIGIQKNEPVSMNMLAIILLSNNPTPKTRKTAYALIMRSAELGYRSAQHNMGVALIYGQSQRKIDNKKGARFLKAAADQNFPPSFFYVGLLYHYGIGVKQDLQLAVNYYKKALKVNPDCAGFELIQIAREKPDLISSNAIDLDHLKVATYKACIDNYKSYSNENFVRTPILLANGIGGPKNIALANEIRAHAQPILELGMASGGVFSKYQLGLFLLANKSPKGLTLVEDAAKDGLQLAKYYLHKRHKIPVALKDE